MIGYSRAAEGFIDRVSLNPEWGYHIQGILDDHKDPGYVYKKIPVLGPISHLETFLAANTLDEIVITLSIGEYANLEQIVAACENPACIRNLFRITIILSLRSLIWKIFRDFL